MYSFKNDLEFGNKFEQKALEYFNYKTVEFPQGIHKEYDFIYNGKIKVEVKADLMGYRTGNIAVEFDCNGKRSGIRATTAKYWVHFVVNPKDHSDFTVYKFRVKEFKKFLKNNSFRQVRGGDGYRSNMYLVPINSLKIYQLNTIQ